MGSIAKKGLQQYLLQLQRHPLRTKAITAGVLSAISDTVAQKLSGIEKLQLRRLVLKVKKPYYIKHRRWPDLRRFYAHWTGFRWTCLFGFAYLGPFGHYLHIVLEKIFKGKKDTKTVAQKVVLEQLTSSPWNNMMFMLYYGFIVERRPWNHVKGRIKTEYPKIQFTSWTFWPVVSWINHQYVPLQLRVIFQSCVACFWGIFLNLRARSMALTKG